MRRAPAAAPPQQRQRRGAVCVGQRPRAGARPTGRCRARQSRPARHASGVRAATLCTPDDTAVQRPGWYACSPGSRPGWLQHKRLHHGSCRRQQRRVCGRVGVPRAQARYAGAMGSENVQPGCCCRRRCGMSNATPHTRWCRAGRGTCFGRAPRGRVTTARTWSGGTAPPPPRARQWHQRQRAESSSPSTTATPSRGRSRCCRVRVTQS